MNLRYCVGGPFDRPCTQFGQHLDDCTNEHCRGCYPKLATQGFLCDTCDTYLRQWLDCTSHTPRNPNGRPVALGHVPACRDADCPGCEYQPNSLLWVHWWLGLAQSARMSRSKWGDKIKAGRDDLPSPLSESILDCRSLLEDRVYIIEERLLEGLGQPIGKPQPRSAWASQPLFNMADAVSFIGRNVIRIEDEEALCRHVWERLQDSMVNAHLLAPWRAETKRLHGIPCPHCERASLAIFGGDGFATCLTCRATVVSKRFDQWVAMLRHEQETA